MRFSHSSFKIALFLFSSSLASFPISGVSEISLESSNNAFAVLVEQQFLPMTSEKALISCAVCCNPIPKSCHATYGEQNFMEIKALSICELCENFRDTIQEEIAPLATPIAKLKSASHKFI